MLQRFLVSQYENRYSKYFVFLLPAMVLVIGLFVVDAAQEGSQKRYDDRYHQRFEADAALRLLVSESLTHQIRNRLATLKTFLKSQSYDGLDVLSEDIGSTVDALFSQTPSSDFVHLILGSISARGTVTVDVAYPRSELIGSQITEHPMLKNLDLNLQAPFTDQLVYRATRQNDLTFSSDGPIIVRRDLIKSEGLDRPLVAIVKINLIELQRSVDVILRELGPLPALSVTSIAQMSDECMMFYRASLGEQVCPDDLGDLSSALISERNGLLTYVRATPEYINNFEGGRPSFLYSELLIVLVASGVALVGSIFLYRRLSSSEIQLDVYRGSLDNKERLTNAIHSEVTTNLNQVIALAQRVKDSENIDAEGERYLRIALSEINELRLNLDAQIMADETSRGGFARISDDEIIDTRELGGRIQAELHRMTTDEGVDYRFLLDDDLPASINGSQYWTESALFAFINTSKCFTDEGFIEFSLWSEVSLGGDVALCARIRDTGIEWSIGESETEHLPVQNLRAILSGLRADMRSQKVLVGVGNEHIIRFHNPSPS